MTGDKLAKKYEEKRTETYTLIPHMKHSHRLSIATKVRSDICTRQNIIKLAE